MWCLCVFGKHLEVRIVQQKNSIVPINDINVLHCQSTQLWSGSWKYPFHFWLYQGLNNTICSVIDMLVFLSYVNLCQTEVREVVAKLARSPLHLLHGGPGVVKVDGQLQTACEKAALFSVMLYSNTHSSFSSLIKRFGLPWCPRWGPTDQLFREPTRHMQFTNSLQRGKSLSLLKPALVGCDSCSEGIRMLF